MQTPGWGCSRGCSLLRQGFKSRPFYQTPSTLSRRGPRGSLPFALLPARTFNSSPSRSLTLLSPERIVNDSLRQLKHDRWGWVIYRCTYDDNEAWTRFKQLINQKSRKRTSESETPELGDSLEWTFVEDPATLDGASKDQLRSHFKAWVTEASRAEQYRAVDDLFGTYGVPRYNYFIQVDEAALRSVAHETAQASYSDEDVDGQGYVNFVKADWQPMSELVSGLGLESRGMDADEEYESIDGCCEQDVGWMKIASWMVGVGFYQAIGGPSDLWYCFYQRPPEIVYY